MGNGIPCVTPRIPSPTQRVERGGARYRSAPRALLLRAVAGFFALLSVSALGVTAQLRVAAGVRCAWWSRRTVAAANGRAELSRCWLSPHCS